MPRSQSLWDGEKQKLMLDYPITRWANPEKSLKPKLFAVPAVFAVFAVVHIISCCGLFNLRLELDKAVIEREIVDMNNDVA